MLLTTIEKGKVTQDMRDSDMLAISLFITRLRTSDSINKYLFWGSTALMWAVQQKSHFTVEQLLSFGADPNIGDDNNMTPLMVAGRDGSVSIVKALLEAGANPNAKDWLGNTVLTWAHKNESAEAKQCAEIFIATGINLHV